MIMKDVHGNHVQIADEELQKHLHALPSAESLEKRFESGLQSMAFSIGGKHMMLTREEMAEIADAWWNHYGKHGMTEFFTRYQKRAEENIRKVLGFAECPKDEKEIKGSISFALTHHPEVAAEVIFEAMEWESAYSALESSKK